jgi:hypothetical protein
MSKQLKKETMRTKGSDENREKELTERSKDVFRYSARWFPFFGFWNRT